MVQRNKINNKMKVELNKHIWEGWLVSDFIRELESLVEMAVKGRSHIKQITTKAELKDFLKENQPYYKKHIPDVFNYFLNKYKEIK